MKSCIFSNAENNEMLQHWLDFGSGEAHSADPIYGETPQL